MREKEGRRIKKKEEVGRVTHRVWLSIQCISHSLVPLWSPWSLFSCYSRPSRKPSSPRISVYKKTIRWSAPLRGITLLFIPTLSKVRQSERPREILLVFSYSPRKKMRTKEQGRCRKPRSYPFLRRSGQGRERKEGWIEVRNLPLAELTGSHSIAQIRVYMCLIYLRSHQILMYGGE